MAPWKTHTIAEAVRRVAATRRGAALYSELAALGWWFGATRESIDRAKRYAEESPHRARIPWLLSELYDLELAELDRLAELASVANSNERGGSPGRGRVSSTRRD